MRTVVIRGSGGAVTEIVAEPAAQPGQHVASRADDRIVAKRLEFPTAATSLVRFSPIPGHEIAATILQGPPSGSDLAPGTNVTRFVQEKLDVLGSRNTLPENCARVIKMLESDGCRSSKDRYDCFAGAGA